MYLVDHVRFRSGGGTVHVDGGLRAARSCGETPRLCVVRPYIFLSSCVNLQLKKLINISRYGYLNVTCNFPPWLPNGHQDCPLMYLISPPGFQNSDFPKTSFVCFRIRLDIFLCYVVVEKKLQLSKPRYASSLIVRIC